VSDQFVVGPPAASPRTRDWRAIVAQPFQPRDARLPADQKFAAFVVHGVGQQTKFETLQTVAEGMARTARQVGLAVEGPPVARLVAVGETRIQRIELTLRGGAGNRELHLYEGYWAPITEGAITLRDVIHLVFRAIATGVNNGTGEFRRWLFGRSQQFPPQLRTVAYLLAGLAALLSVIVINLAISAIVGTRWALGAGEKVIGDGLYGDLSTAFNILFVVLAGFAALLALQRSLWRARAPAAFKSLVGYLAVLGFVMVLAATTAVGLAIPMFFYLHRVAGPTHARPLLPMLLGLRRVDLFNDWVELHVLLWVVVALLVMALAILLRIGFAWWRAWRLRSAQKWTAPALLLVALGTVGLLAEGFVLGLNDWGIGVGGGSGLERGAVWALLVAASLFARRVLVEYLGDLVAYVQSHTLDRFDTLRDKIKAAVFEQADAVYSLRNSNGEYEYSEVAVIGHSLGSVVAYDTLNKLINEDAILAQMAPGEELRVVERTCLLLTFGSPLDKTAYLFGAQRKQTPGGDALAATVQPLIQHPSYRPPIWVNVHSPWDPISGTLEYYDHHGRDARGSDGRLVRNERDPDATTLFLAHLEYWDGSLIYRTLLQSLPWRFTPARKPNDVVSCPHPGVPAALGTTGLEGI
jgi:hypothetical protein